MKITAVVLQGLSLLVAVPGFCQVPGAAASFSPVESLVLDGDARLKDGLLVCDGKGQAALPGTEDCSISDAGLTVCVVARLRTAEQKDYIGSDFASKLGEWQFVREQNGAFIFHFKDSKDGWFNFARCRTIVPDGVWTHYAASVSRIRRTADGAVGYLVKLYVNGELLASRECLGIELGKPSSEPVRLAWGGGGALRGLCGEVADARVWKRALSDDEIEKDAAGSPHVRVPGLDRRPVTPAFEKRLADLRGPDAPWLRAALRRAAENGADQAVLARGGWKVVETSQAKALLLLKGAGRAFPLAGFYDKRRGRETFGRRTFGWKLVTAAGGKIETWTDDEDGFAREVRETKSGLTAVWRRDGVAVTTSFRIAGGRLETKARIANANPTRLLRELTYPEASFAPLPEKGRDRLLLPFMGGVEHFDPVTTQSSVAEQDGYYPSGFMSLQMGAYYDDHGGVYFADEDPTAALKHVVYRGRRGNVDVSYSHAIAFAPGRTGGNAFDLPGVGAVELIDGGWFEAAQAYKRFLSTKAAWWVRDLPRKETPEWLRNSSIWFEHRIMPHLGYTMERVERDFIRLRDYFELPIGLHTREFVDHWKTGYWPHYQPDPELVAHLNRLRAHDMRIVGYVDDRLWCKNDSPGLTNDWMYTSHGKKLELKFENGQNPMERYALVFTNAVGERYEKTLEYPIMCPATKGWQQWMIGQCELIQREARLDGIYHDQIMAARGYPCFAAGHGHLLNDAQDWVAHGYWPYMRELRARTAAINPETVHASEDAAEPYLAGQMDVCMNWRWTHQMVPLFVSLYAGRYQFYGRVMGDTVDPLAEREGFFSKVAEELVWGEQIGRIDEGAFNGEIGDREAMLFAKRAAHLRRALADWFNGSDFQKPPTFRAKMPVVGHVWNGYRGGSGGGDRKIFHDQVRATSWLRQADGARMAVFVNTELTPIDFEPVLPGFGKAIALADGQEPRTVADGKFCLSLMPRGMGVVIAGPDDLLAAESARLKPIMSRIASFVEMK